MHSRILQIAVCLVLGSVSSGLSQTHSNLTNELQIASAGLELQVASASPYVSTGDFTNQHLTLLSVPAPKGAPGPGLSYSMPPDQRRSESELNQPNLPSRVRLADLLQTTSPHGWRIGDDGVLGYRSRDRRCRLVFRYTPDIRALSGDFDRLDYFSLVWQFSLGKLKPAN
jgi:hypothetical protein